MADVFVGFYYDQQKAEQLLSVSKVGISAAANQYQEGFLSGLPECPQILTTLSVGAYPHHNKQLRFLRDTGESAVGKITYLPFTNLYFLRDWQLRRGLYKELARMIRQQPGTTVYVYSLNVNFEKVMAKLKRKFGNSFHYCLIIPDLPGAYGIVRGGIKGIKDRMDARPKMKLAAAADSYVFLTEAMKELFPSKPYTVIEGFLPLCAFHYENQRIPKTVLYTGTLNLQFGIKTLLDAFSLLQDPDCRLWICGGGAGEALVKEAAKKDPRIEFKGFLPKNEIANLQTQCDVLINPRPDEGEYTKYSFPSKTMEYLLSGSKVVMYKLPGIGDEYYQYIRTIETPDAAAMAAVLQEAFADTQFYKGRFREQITWIRQTKSATQQIHKVLKK